MSNISSAIRRISLVALATSALVLTTALPASAAEPFSLYGGYGDYVAGELVGEGVGVVSKSDASIAPLPNVTPEDAFYGAIEIVGGVGYAVGSTDDDGHVVFTWDAATGAQSAAVPIFAANSTFYGLSALTATENDETLPDGTLITTMGINTPQDGNLVRYFVGSVDPTTGEFTRLVEFSSLYIESSFVVDELASDPTSGLTYLLGHYSDGVPVAVTLDLAGGTYEAPEPLTGIESSLDIYQILGADFDTDGVLWFYFSNESEYLGHTVGEFGPGASAVLLGAASALVGESGRDAYAYQLAVGPAVDEPAVPQLAATGASPAQPLLIGGAALVLGAVAFGVARRRRTA